MTLDLSALAPGLRLAQAPALGLLPLLPLWLWWVRRGARRQGGLTFVHAALGDLPRSWRVRWQPLPDVVRMLVLACLILGLARPQFGRDREKITQKGVDIMLALDVSGSMVAEDVAPNRISAAKRTISRFVERLQGDRVGLVVFAGRSFTQCPLTTDYGALLSLVRECSIEMLASFEGTAIGDALANCVYRFEADARRAAGPNATPAAQAAATQAAKQRSRVIVLLTDGSNNKGDIAPLDAAEMARLKNIRVHCIGLGSPTGAPLPYYAEGVRHYAQRSDGSVLVTRMDTENLKQIAALAGGQFFAATDSAGLDRIYQQIGAMERHDVEVKHLTQYDERFLLPIMLGLALLLLELLLRSTVLRVTA